MTDALPAPLPPFLPEALRHESSAVALQRGDKLFHCGEPVSHIHFVVAGELPAVRYLRDGSEAVMQRARGGEFFAQSAMLVPHYSCDARAACTSEVVRLPVEALRDTLVADGDRAPSGRCC